MAIRLLVLFVCICVGVGGREAKAEEPDAAPRLLRGQLSASGWLTSFDGYLQTPAGGMVGSTSPKRPTFPEIDLDGLRVVPQLDAELILLEDHGLHTNVFFRELDGSGTLGQGLTSQGQTLLAGAPYKSSFEALFVRAGYRAYWLALQCGDWQLVPEAGVAMFDFTYKLSDNSGPRVNRSYSFGTPYVGFKLDGPIRLIDSLADSLRFEAELGGFGGINGVRHIDGDLRLVYRIASRQLGTLSAVAGLRGFWLRRKDSQGGVPNDVNVRLGSFSNDPWAGLHLGLRADF